MLSFRKYFYNSNKADNNNIRSFNKPLQAWHLNGVMRFPHKLVIGIPIQFRWYHSPQTSHSIPAVEMLFSHGIRHVQ